MNIIIKNTIDDIAKEIPKLTFDFLHIIPCIKKEIGNKVNKNIMYNPNKSNLIQFIILDKQSTEVIIKIIDGKIIINIFFDFIKIPLFYKFTLQNNI